MVQINEDEHAAKVIVPDNQLSLAIGMRGINAKSAARLTGWKTASRANPRRRKCTMSFWNEARWEQTPTEE